MSSLSILTGATAAGCRRTRHGDSVVVVMQSTAFAVLALDLTKVESWVRATASIGGGQRDLTAFVARFDHVLARTGGGVATRGSDVVLARIARDLIANNVDVSGWAMPRSVRESLDVHPAMPPSGTSDSAEKDA